MTSRPNRTSTARFTVPRRSSRPTSSAPQPAGDDARVVGRAAASRARCLPIPRRVDRRGVRLPRRRGSRAFRETTPYAPPTAETEGGLRSSCARISTHLRQSTNADDELLQQLRGRGSFPEKLIPLMIVNAIAGKFRCTAMAVTCATGWPFGDHCTAIRTVLANGHPGETYNVGGNAEIQNLEVVNAICAVLAEERPGRDYASLVTYVKDPPATTAATRSIPARSAASFCGSRRRLRFRAAPHDPLVPRQRRLARKREQARRTTRSGSTSEYAAA